MSERDLRALSKEVVLADVGDPPWACECGCGAVLMEIGVRSGQAIVHHIDEDLTNYKRSNLQLLKTNCHRRYHATGHVETAIARQRKSDAQRGRALHPKHAAKLKISNSQSRLCVCGYISNPGALGKHQKKTGHSEWSVA